MIARSASPRLEARRLSYFVVARSRQRTNRRAAHSTRTLCARCVRPCVARVQLGLLDFAGGAVVEMNSGISAFALARVLGARVAWRYGEKLPSLMQRRSLDDPRAASSRSLRSQDNDSPRRQRRSQDEAPPMAPRQRCSQDEAPSPHRESHHHHHHHGAQVPLGRWNRIASMRGLYNAPVAAEVEAPAAAGEPVGNDDGWQDAALVSALEMASAPPPAEEESSADAVPPTEGASAAVGEEEEEPLSK